MFVSTERLDDVAVLSLTRDEKRNAISMALADELTSAVEGLTDSVRAVVLTGEGSCFSAGADLSEDKVGPGFFNSFDALTDAIRTADAPVIAYVNGPAIGAGAMLTLACDIRVIAPQAQFRIPVGDVAIGVSKWVVRALADLVGGARARTMLYTGLPLSADEAVACGFGLAGQYDDALEIARLVAAKAPLTQRNIKMQFAPELYSAEQRTAATAAPFASEDIREAARARAEKRPPRFIGR
ncbi:enoyl-CoA hydratase-related protein [Corynebacterium sp.]|uniref:enoyl-CoA hydratase-related protein n=1 Tax=Corynebacterium sp. TaxID=1720 RepID=UPI002A91DE5F|nr:enoyl-CoA hydratase-related protein [Corynebacterium sp.]MDY5785581.1 enoyl-CoA hydratase-related protein [Corynebacterium sp.]